SAVRFFRSSRTLRTRAIKRSRSFLDATSVPLAPRQKGNRAGRHRGTVTAAIAEGSARRLALGQGVTQYRRQRMGKRPTFGTCHVCGEYGKLSAEHVPPKSAFNDRRVVLHHLSYGRPGDRQSKKIYQNRLSYPVLCERCNNDTGRWYGTSYAHFAQYCAERATP